MKRTITIIFCLLLIGTAIKAEEERLRIVASASMISDIAFNIIGDLHDIEMIVPIGGDPHLYKPVPSDAQLVNHADLLLVNGLTFEGWLTELIDNSGADAETVTVSDGVDVLRSLTYKNSSDPHAWMSVENVVVYAENIKNAMVKLDPTNAVVYGVNFDRYKNELQELHQYIIIKINNIPKKQRILITSHDAFQYYGRAYGIRLEAIMGISTEAEAQTSDVVRVNKVIKENNIPALFIESTINPKLINQLASDNNIRIGGQLYADSLGDKDSGADTYIKMMRYVTDTISKGLSLKQEQAIADKKSSINLPYIFGLAGVLLLGLIAIIVKMNK